MADPMSPEIGLENATRFADPPMLLRTTKAGGFLRANAAFLAGVGYGDEELAGAPFPDWLDPDDVEDATATIEGRRDACRVRHRTRDGGHLTLDVRAVAHEGGFMILARRPGDAPPDEGPDDADDEATVAGTLHTIARIVEDQNPGYRCSILLVADGRFVRGAGPSLPEDYNAAIDGYAVGPTVGSCGTAIHWNVPVIVEDIQADPLWAPIAELAAKAGVAACWSHPFTSRSGNVLGALAFYAPEPRAPTPEQLGRLKAAARMTGLAVERGRAEEALRAQRRRERELEDQLRQAAKMEALGVLAGGVAHDFNNVLSTILANAELGRELLPPDSEVQDMLADIIEASKRAGRFCQQMLSYAGRGTLRTSRVEIGSLIPELSTLVQAAVSKKTTLEYALLERPVHVVGDENQLLQVIMNLVTNAAEAIGDNEGRIVVSSEVADYDETGLRRLDPQAGLRPGEYVRLSVSDTGPGIDAGTAARIFDPFFTTKDTGRGLGLSAVKGIIGQHGGTIWIDSEPGRGTTFTVALPTVEHEGREESVTTAPAPDIGRRRILVADDEPALLSVLTRQLKHAGFEVLAAADGQEAVDLFREHGDSVDCALLDFSMPRLNGEEAQRALHALWPDLPIVMMSGFGEQEVCNRFHENGIVCCLQKPILAAVLRDAILEALNEG